MTALVEGTPYSLRELSTGWWVCSASGGIALAGPYRTRGEALSVAIARTRERVTA